MKKSPFLLVFISLILFVACRSEFERIRTSGNATLILETATNMYNEGQYERAIILYELILPSYRGRTEAEELTFNYSDAHYKGGSYILAAHYFKTFADTYTGSPRREEALYLTAMSHYLMSPKYKLDQEDSQKAINSFQTFVNTFPASDKVEDANKYIDELRLKLEKKSFDSAKLYYQIGNYSSAIQSFENMLKDFPGSEKEEEARYLIVKASHQWAQNSIYTRQEERFRKTIERCDLFIKKHPRSPKKEEVISFKTESQKELNKFQNG